MTRRFPDAPELTALCEKLLADGLRIIERAQRAGALRDDFTLADLPLILLSASAIVRATGDVAPQAWRRLLGFLLDGLRAGATRPLAHPALTPEQLRGAMTR
jgi:hypothetical protein